MPNNTPYTGTIQKDNLRPAPYEHPANPGEFAQNLTTDVGNTIQGLASVGSAAMGRLYEAQPLDLFSGKVFQPGYQSAKDGWGQTSLGGQPLIRPGDFPAAGGIALGIINGYKTDYVDPVLQGQPGKIVDRFFQKPLTTTMDLMPLKAPIGKMTSSGSVMLGKAVESTALGQKAIQTGHALMDHIAAKATPFVSPITNYFQQKAAIAKVVASADHSFIDDVNRGFEYVKEAFDSVPKALQKDLIAAGEMRDPALRAALNKSPEAVEFWRRAGQLNDEIAERLIAAGAMTRHEMDLAKYGPMTGLTPAELVTEVGQQTLKEAIASGAKPTYFGIVTNGQVRSAAKIRGSLFRAERSVVKHAQSEGEAIAQAGGKPGFLRGRTKGLREEAKHSEHALDVWTTRYAQGLQFLALKDFFMDILKNPKFVGETGFNTKDFFRKLARSQNIPETEIKKFIKLHNIPEFVGLPKIVADKLEDLKKGLYGTRSGFIDETLGRISTVQKTAQLGFNLGWAAWTLPQNMINYGIAAFRGVHDIPASIMAFPLAFDKEVMKAIPKYWLTDLSDGAAASRNLEGLAKAYAPAAWISSRVFGLSSASDNFARSAFGIYNLLKEARKQSPNVQKALSEAFDLQAQKANALTLLKNNPAEILQTTKEIEKWFGRYDQLFNHEQRVMRAIAPYWNWWMHAKSITLALPETPFKASLISRLSQAAPIVLQDRKKLTESDIRSGAVALNRKGPNNKTLIMNGNQLSLPMQTSFETLRWLLARLDTQSTDKVQWPMLNASIGMTANQLGVDTSGSEFNDPSLIKTRGMTFNSKGQKVETVKPDPLHTVMRNVAPSSEAQMRSMVALPYKPSTSTSVLNLEDAKVKRNFKTGRPEMNFTLTEQMLSQISKLNPREQAITPADEKRMKRAEKKAFRKALRRQRAKLIPVHPSWSRGLSDMYENLTAGYGTDSDQNAAALQYLTGGYTGD